MIGCNLGGKAADVVVYTGHHDVAGVAQIDVVATELLQLGLELGDVIFGFRDIELLPVGAIQLQQAIALAALLGVKVDRALGVRRWD